jgi:hypothetical protein
LFKVKRVKNELRTSSSPLIIFHAIITFQPVLNFCGPKDYKIIYQL